MDRTSRALSLFNQGFKCSQAVLEVFAKDFGMDIETARKIALPLAGGATTGGECGAISAAFMVMGLKYGETNSDSPALFDVLKDKMENFTFKFKETHGCLLCPELTGVDIFTEEGSEKFAKENMKKNKCQNFVRDTVEFLEESLKD